MRTTKAAAWTRSESLPDKPVSFTGVSYGEMVERARARIRVGGLAQLSGFDLSLDPRRRGTLAPPGFTS